MLRNTQKRVAQLAFIGLCLLPTTLSALIMVREGNEPFEGRGWPTGAEAVANLPSRFRCQEGPPFGGGEYFFQYHCENTAEFNSVLQKFSAIHVPRLTMKSLMSLDGQRTKIMHHKPLLLVVHDWLRDTSTKEHHLKVFIEKNRADWTFTVWVPGNFHRLFNNPKRPYFSDHPNFRQPVPPPRIDVYVGGNSPIVWEEIEVPSNVQVLDKRAEAAPVNLEGGGVIRGGVFDISTHQIITDADVILVKRTEPRDWNETARTKTDSNGLFELRNIPHGYYKIHIEANGYANRDMGAFNNLNEYTYEEFDALLAKTVSCKGVVQDKEGNAIPGVTVIAYEMLGINGLGYKCSSDPSATTDEKGRFELLCLPEGFTNIRCVAPSLHQETSHFEMYKVSAQPWDVPEDIEIVMSGTWQGH